MNLSSIRVGMILIGLGLLLWGLKIQRKYEGFQESQMPPQMPPQMPSSPSLPPGLSLPPSLPPSPSPPPSPPGILIQNPTEERLKPVSNADIALFTNSLAAVVLQIKSKFNLIRQNKSSIDAKMVKFISDTDIMSKINILYYEVKSFIDSIDKLSFNKFDTPIDTLASKTIHRIIYTAQDQINILYRIYFTIPSMIVSSGVIVSPDTATDMSILNDEVLAKSITMINMELIGVPSVANEIPTVRTKLLDSVKILQATPSDELIGVVQGLLTRLLSFVDMELSSYDEKISNLKASYLTIKITNTTNEKILLLKNTISNLQSIHDILNTSTNKQPTLITTIQNSIELYNVRMTSAQASLVKTEGFQSYSNPYGIPSPSLQQAYEFRLSKSAYSDSIFSTLDRWIF